MVPGNTVASNPITLMIAPGDATFTPTPFQPLDPTPTYIPTDVPTPLPSPTPNGPSTSPGETVPANPLELSADRINILLLGSDQRVEYGGYRTDTIILFSINQAEKTASMISFPRDLYVFIPEWGYERINTAMVRGGFDLLSRTLNYNFGIQPDYYILVNFSGFTQLIDSLGGIEVITSRSYTDKYWDSSYRTIPQGTVHMDGDTALWYARVRKASNDFDRARRQQEVLRAVANRLISVNALEKAQDLYQIYIANVETNLTWSEITPLLPLAVAFQDTSRIRQYVIGPQEVYDWITPGGAMVLIPRHDKINALLQQAFDIQQ